MTESNLHQTATISAVVRPLRFSADVPSMREFLELLGLTARESRREDWVVMLGAAGMVALHSTVTVASGGVSGQTDLCFETPDLDVLARRLADAGLETDIYDEAWGRAMSVSTGGTQVTVDETPADLYGYAVDESQPSNEIVVMPLYFDSPTDSSVGQLMAALGYAVSEDSHDGWWRVWRKADGGELALHRPVDDAEQATSQLGFRTVEPLDSLARRLKDSGYDDASESPDFGGELTVTDPDGQRVLVLPSRGMRG